MTKPEAAVDLICYLHPGWAPLIRPAPATRQWMDDTPESFAYRCLPLNIANAHGWEILSPCAFDAVWNGGTTIDAITVEPEAGAASRRLPVSLFGQGVLTFHVEGILRTPPGWNLWVSGSPNRFKDGIQPLSAVVETDWSPFTFTMNWRFTRPGHRIHFDAMEPFCFIFPVQRAAVEAFEPRLAPMNADMPLQKRFGDWSKARDAFHAKMSREPPSAGADKWQKHYYRGVDVSGAALIDDHRAKLRLRPFDRSAVPGVPEAPADDMRTPPAQTAVATEPSSPEQAVATRDLRKREWLLEAIERQRELSLATSTIDRRSGLDGEEFLERYYATSRPVILTGELDAWPALSRWTADYLARTVGSKIVEFQGDRASNARFEIEKAAHRRQAPFDDFIRMITSPGAANDAYITAYNSARNDDALAALHPDMGMLDKFLAPGSDRPYGMMWIGPAGTMTSLHHDLTNNLIAQVVGRKQLKLLPASEVGRVYNHQHVFSEIADLDDPGLDVAKFPKLAGARMYEVDLEPGEILFVPLGWWHQVRALDFSVTVTYTNFRWPNDASATYPGE